MTPRIKKKIVYILPEYDTKTGSHFFYLHQLLDRACGDLDIMLVIERAKSFPPGGFRVYAQHFSFAPFRFAELFFVLLLERMRGRKNFYTHYSYFGAAASWMIAALFGGKAFYWNCGMPWLYKRSRLEEAAFRFILRNTVLVTGTAGLAREYQKRYGVGSFRVLPNWIDVERFRNYGPAGILKRPANAIGNRRGSMGIPGGAKVILFVHRLSRRKGAHLLPGIISEVTKARKDVIFVIVGNGPERNNLESGIQNSGLAKYARVIGEVPQEEISGYFQMADVFLMPSEEEGFPHVLLEAMAAGVPFVASRVGGVREIAPPEFGPFILADADSVRFAEKAIEMLQKPPAEREAMREKERSRAAKYDLSNAVPKFVNLF